MFWRKKPKVGDKIVISNACQFEVNTGNYQNGDIFTVKKVFKGYVYVEEIDRPIDWSEFKILRT
jgi:hypothetical protein